MLHKVEHSISQRRFKACGKLTISVASSPAALHMHRGNTAQLWPAFHHYIEGCTADKNALSV
jgi:hypothetical protein